LTLPREVLLGIRASFITPIDRIEELARFV
jgi:hypothetical protein